jgi:hypothetical protein
MVSHTVELRRQLADLIVGLDGDSVVEIAAADLLGAFAKPDNGFRKPPA